MANSYPNILKIIFVLGVFIGGIYLFFNIYSDKYAKEIVIIYPDETETKIKPKEAGGIVIPNSDNIIYENIQPHSATTRKVSILAEPEQPLNITYQKIQSGEPLHSIDTILENIISNDKNTNEPVIVQDDNIDNILPNIIIEKNPEEQQSVTLTSSKNPTSNTTLNVIKVAEKTSRFEQNKVSLAKTNNLYKIQLASVKSEADGIKEWERLKKKYYKILVNSVMTLKKIQHHKGNFFYIVLAGDYKNPSQAKAICKKLTNIQQNCIVTK